MRISKVFVFFEKYGLLKLTIHATVYIVFMKEENDVVCEYISLIPLSDQKLNAIFNLQELHEKGYY